MRGTQVKSVLNGGSVGFWIAGNFYKMGAKAHSSALLWVG